MKLHREHFMNVWHLSFLFLTHTANHLKMMMQSQGLFVCGVPPSACEGGSPSECVYLGPPPRRQVVCVCPISLCGQFFLQPLHVPIKSALKTSQPCIQPHTVIGLGGGGWGLAPVGYVIDIIICLTYGKWAGASSALLTLTGETQLPLATSFSTSQSLGTHHVISCSNKCVTCTVQVAPPAAKHLSAHLK